jgi:hypothetical protein
VGKSKKAVKSEDKGKKSLGLEGSIPDVHVGRITAAVYM